MDLDGMVMDSDDGALELGLLGGGFSRLLGWPRRREDGHRSVRLNPAESLMERSSSRRNASRGPYTGRPSRRTPWHRPQARTAARTSP
jgi:hypothetical protein